MSEAQERRLIAPEEWQHQRWGWLESVRRDAGLSDRAKVLAHVLAMDFANRDTLRCDPTVKQLCDLLGKSKPTMTATIRDLLEAGWILRTSGKWRGERGGFGFLTPAKIVRLRVIENTAKGERNLTPLAASQRGKISSRKGKEIKPPYNIDKPSNNQGSAKAAPDAKKNADQIAHFWVKKIREGGFVTASAISITTAGRMIELGLITEAELRAAGVQF